MKTNKLKVNILNATHLRALSTSPVALRAVGSGFSLPGISPVRKSACETSASSRLFEREARVKAA